jgi:hypothetical protein
MRIVYDEDKEKSRGGSGRVKGEEIEEERRFHTEATEEEHRGHGELAAKPVG